MNRESKLIARITATVRRAGVPTGRTGLRLGIGDDAALFAPRPGCEVVVSTDFFNEGTHFFAKLQPAESVGYKSIARAVSDLSAMGAVSGYFLISLALPESKMGIWFDDYFRGVGEAAKKSRMLLIGGDLAKSKRVSISVTAIGFVPLGKAVRRSGARPGDLIYVSGRLGGARLGLEILRKGYRSAAGASQLLAPEFYPPIRLALAKWILSERMASAMMDISDGLSIDLSRLCEASRVGARIEAERIPRAKVSAAWRRRLRLNSVASLEYALHGGDDYELLFTVRPHQKHKLRAVHQGVPLTRIGTITREAGVVLSDADGHLTPLEAKGWDHFGGSD